MNHLITETISIPREEAEAKLTAYRASLATRQDAEYEAAVCAYEQLAKGTPLVSLREVFSRLGLEHYDEKGRPRMAIARADRKEVKMSSTTNWNLIGKQTLVFNAHKDMWSHQSDQLRLAIPTERTQKASDGYALVPMIPADVRARMKTRSNGQDRKHFILWEVDEWSDTRIGAPPPRDPWLLLPIGWPTDLYAVVDEWELTDVERYVMQNRRHDN